jgi:hypothetical protein
MPEAILRNVPWMQAASPVAEEQAAALPEKLFVEKYVNHSLPCLVRGAVAHWPAVEKWQSARYLKDLCGHRRVLYFPHENHVTLDRMLAGKRELSLGQALDLLHCDQTEVASLGLSEDLAELRPDVGRFSFLTRAEPSFIFPPIRYFIYRNAGSAWHYHPLDETLMCQLVGSKKVGLLRVEGSTFAPLKNLFGAEEYYDGMEAFQGFDAAGLQCLAATLEAGDALYIPPLWWHGVVTKSSGFGVTAAIPWRSPSHVIAGDIRKMARGEAELMGSATRAQIGALLATARKLGAEKDLAAAWDLSGKTLSELHG